MSPVERSWHPNFIEYMDFIVNHPNYSGMPHLYKSDGTIRWVVTGNSKMGQDRTNWWEKKGTELGIPIVGRWISKVAKENHPTKLKICQTCGRELIIEYVYPNKRTIKRLNQISGLIEEFVHEDFKTIFEIIDEIILDLGESGLEEISKKFKIPRNIDKNSDSYKDYIYENLVKKEKKVFSPGVMSNAPDRLDGFHSYNICCRAVQDTGRHQENLARYSEDRRAYEHWSDGDWKAASWLMKRKGNGVCVICKETKKITADHIGPISLGFAHLPIFQPMCRSCNSTKNNRMFLQDVLKLTQMEKDGITVISWYAKYIWDQLKGRVKNQRDGKKLSKLMRIAHHYFLELFYEISSQGFKDFLMNYLNPEYAFYEQIDFKNLDESTFEHNGVTKIPGDKTQYQNSANRYVRIAFESLEEYHNKENRRIISINCNGYEKKVNEIIKLLKNDKNFNEKLREYLSSAFELTDKKAIGDQIKIALDESEAHPYFNNQIDEEIKSVLKKIADCISEIW